MTKSANTNAPVHAEARMQEPAECEPHLLRTIPCIPEFYDVWVHPPKPYALGGIDTHWRPQ